MQSFRDSFGNFLQVFQVFLLKNSFRNISIEGFSRNSKKTQYKYFFSNFSKKILKNFFQGFHYKTLSHFFNLPKTALEIHLGNFPKYSRRKSSRILNLNSPRVHSRFFYGLLHKFQQGFLPKLLKI